MVQIDWVTQVDPCLQESPSYGQPANRAKVLQDSMSQHNVTNPNKLKLVNYNRKIYNTEIFKVQNFVDSTRTHQIRQTFPPSKFCAIRYYYCADLHIIIIIIITSSGDLQPSTAIANQLLGKPV